MLQELLSPNRIVLQTVVPDWEAAARRAGELLLSDGGIEPRYVDAMVDTVRTEGAYIVLTKGFALFHARPECGVLRECACLLTLSHPVVFGAGENDPVDVVIAYGSPESDGHVRFLQELAGLLMRPGFLDELRTCRSYTEVKHLLMQQE